MQWPGVSSVTNSNKSCYSHDIKLLRNATKVTGWLVVSALDFRSEGRWFNSLEKKLYSTLSLHPSVYNAGDKAEMDYNPIQKGVTILLFPS